MLLRLITLCLAAGAASGSGNVTYPAGVQASLSASAINYLVAQLLPLLTKKFATITIPDISGSQDGFDYDLTAIKCANFAVASAGVASTPPSTLSLALSGISVACTANWHFALRSWPHFPSGSGNLDASVSSTTAAVVVTLGAAALRPTLACPSAALSIGSVDISFHGDSALDWLLNLFKGLIEKAVRDSLGSAFGPLISSFVAEDGNAFLASIPIAVPVSARAPYNISAARFGFVQAPAAQPTLLGLAVQGDVVPLGFAGVPPVPAPAPPAFAASDGAFMVEGRFSPYLLLSAAWTYASASLLQWALAPGALPLGLNATGAYALIAPGMARACPGCAVSLNISVGEASPIAVTINPPSAGGIQAAAVVQLDFFMVAAAGGAAPPPPPALAFSLLANTSFALGVGLRPDPAHPGSLVFNGTLGYLQSALVLGSSSVGPVSVGLLQGLADLVLPFIVASANGDLAKGFPLPPIPGLAFTNATELELDVGFATFKADFTFAPSAVGAAA